MLAGQQIGPFAIETEIGSGAMGTVYRAHYRETGQEVAIKIISAGQDTNPTTLARFEREAAILKKLKHPNIVRLLATGRYRGTPFYVMEYIEGNSLEHLLQRRQRFTWEEIVTLGRQLCAALQHAHQQGIVHRDLKPGNIMITPDDVAKLTDFGIAKGLEITQLTATNCTVGTASYMSPEQCRGERNLTHKSDLYSLGVVFYELLTGRRPFLAETTLDMFLAHTEGKFERPSRLVLDIPIWLDTLVCQLLEKDPEKRPFDAAIVAQALDQIMDKVTAQRSAGVDMVSARRMDVPRDRQPRSEADREAARLLREAMTRKKAKRRGRPFYERGWFLVAGISSLLLALALIIYAVMRPPSPDKLYAQAKYGFESSDPESWDKAREGPIKKFLNHYPDDPRANEVQAWADKVDLDWRERQLNNKLRLNLSPDGEAEHTAYAAIRQEEAGYLDEAIQRWQSLEKPKDGADPDQRLWALLAGKRIREIRAGEAREKQWRDNVEQDRFGVRELKPETDAERWGALAIRAEGFGDPALAIEHWDKIKETFLKDPGQRTWFLLAAKKVRELRGLAPRGPDVLPARRELIVDKLTTAKSLKVSKPGEGLALCRDVLALYGTSDDAEIVRLVAAARELSKDLSRSPN
jgi:serine/threonine-protein kinase